MSEPVFGTLTANISGLTRIEEFEGSKYYVVPMVMMTEGVHIGSNGSLLYTANDLQKYAAAWNNKPIPVYHPMKDGQYVSAADISVLKEQKVGFVLNAQFKKATKDKPARLTADAWVKQTDAERVDKRVATALTSNLATKPMEVSIGLFHDVIKTPGDFNGKHYDAIAVNYRPDHVALLPDKKGACSCNAGCGLGINESDLDKVTANKGGKYCTDCGAKMGNEHKFCANCGGKMTANAAESKLEQETPKMDKKELVDHLVTNAGWVESERPILDGMTEVALAKLVEKIPAKVTVNEKITVNDDKQPVVPAPVVPAVAGAVVKPTTLSDILANSSPEEQEVLRDALESRESERTQLIATITSNTANPFSKEELAAFKTPQLRGMAKLAAPAAAQQPTTNGSPNRLVNYFGQGAAAAPTANAKPVKPMAPLSTPLDFSSRLQK